MRDCIDSWCIGSRYMTTCVCAANHESDLKVVRSRKVIKRYTAANKLPLRFSRSSSPNAASAFRARFHFHDRVAGLIMNAITLCRSAAPESAAVPPLEMLFRLEIEFHRRLRSTAAGVAETSSLHTSYALQSGYEQLIPAVGTVTARQIEQLRERFTLEFDTRDLLTARDSLKSLLGIRLLEA